MWNLEKLFSPFYHVLRIVHDCSSSLSLENTAMVDSTLPTSSTFFAPMALASCVTKLVWFGAVAFNENSFSLSEITYRPKYNSLYTQICGS